jgi:hypothetical protein
MIVQLNYLQWKLAPQSRWEFPKPTRRRPLAESNPIAAENAVLLVNATSSPNRRFKLADIRTIARLKA